MLKKPMTTEELSDRIKGVLKEKGQAAGHSGLWTGGLQSGSDQNL